MASDYPQVAKWIATEFEITPKINSLLDVAVVEDTAILIINSDIEIYGDQSRLTDLVAKGKNRFGIRHSYQLQPGTLLTIHRLRIYVNVYRRKFTRRYLSGC